MTYWHSGYLRVDGLLQQAMALTDPGFSGPGSQRVWLYGTSKA
jgi:hypothetical protein